MLTVPTGEPVEHNQPSPVPSRRYSIRSLLVGVAVVAGLCAIPAQFVAQIRAEAKAGRWLEAAIDEDLRAPSSGHPSSHSVSWGMPEGRIQRLFYRMAGSHRAIDLDIVGPRSARVLKENAQRFSSVSHVRIYGGSGGDNRISQEQISAVSRLRRLDWLQIHGDFDSTIRLRDLSRLERIERLDIHADRFPYQVIHDLGSLQVNWLRLYCDGDHEGDNRLPAEAFASFRHSPCTDVLIFADMDDRAFELLSAAPKLNDLCVESMSGWEDGRASITDDGLLRACPNLHVRTLQIGGTKAAFTEAGAECLATIKELRSLNVALSPAGQKRLRAVRPDL